MNDTVIEARHLSKRYRIGANHLRRNLRESITDVVTTPFRRFAGAQSAAGEQQDHIWALRNVSLSLQQGEVLGIIGPNGAGKSTLLKILSRITKPTEGYARIRGRVGSLLEVGTGFHPELTGRENIYLNGAVLGMKRNEIARKFDEIVAFAEFEQFLDTPIKHYSSGMYMRLAFAVAAHLEPEILIVDEVLAVGDAQFQRKCLGKMKDVAAQGRTVLFVSHNMNAIQRLCSEVIILSQGQIVARGDPINMVQRYLDTSLRESSPREWIDVSGIVRDGSGAVRVAAIQYSSDREELGFRPYTDGPLTFMLSIDSDATRSISSAAIMVYDRSGLKLVNADTISQGKQILVQEGHNQLRVSIESLHLNPGTYRVGWWLANPPRAIYDYAESAVNLDVIDHEISGLGVKPVSDGIVACNFESIIIQDD